MKVMTPEREAELRRIIGDPDVAACEMERYAADAAALASSYGRLVEQHPHKWVAMYGGEVYFADHLEALLELLESRAVPKQHAAIQRLDPRPQILIL